MTVEHGHYDGRGFVHGAGCDRIAHYAQSCPVHMGQPDGRLTRNQPPDSAPRSEPGGPAESPITEAGKVAVQAIRGEYVITNPERLIRQVEKAAAMLAGEAADLYRPQLEAVDAALGPWTGETGDRKGTVGRVATIRALREAADRAAPADDTFREALVKAWRALSKADHGRDCEVRTSLHDHPACDCGLSRATLEAGTALLPFTDADRAFVVQDQAAEYARLGRAAPRSVEAGLPTVEVLAKAICASRPPDPEDLDIFVDDECRAFAARVLARLSAAEGTETP